MRFRRTHVRPVLYRVGIALVLLIGTTPAHARHSLAAVQTGDPVTSIPPGIDIAVQQPATASSATLAEPAANAVDGDAATAWCPADANTDATLTVSFDQLYHLNGTAITWRGPAPAHYELQTSVDGSRWQAFESRQAMSMSMRTSIDMPTASPVAAGSIRLRFSDPSALPCVAALRVYASPPRAMDLIRGVDLSTLPALESAGKSFSDAAGTRAAEQILADHDMNLVRLRLWVNPPTELNTLADVAAMARRVKQANMKVLLNLHYSDFWADPTHQETPAAWQGQDLRTLAATVREYTKSVVATLDQQGTPPDIIQIGNEVSTGMLWPQGRVYADGRERWGEFATLLRAGIEGARAGASPGHVPKIMVHIEQGGDHDTAQRFYDHILEHDVDFDLLGLSYYRYWQGSLSDVQRNLDNLAARYGKPIMIVETAHPWTLDDQDGRANIIGPSHSLPPEYPASPEGQAFLVRDLLSMVARVPGNLGLGVVYWEPAWIPGVGWKPGEAAVWDNQTLFDPAGRALASIDAMRVTPASVSRSAAATPQE